MPFKMLNFTILKPMEKPLNGMMSNSSTSDIPLDNSGYPKQGRPKRIRPRTAGPVGNRGGKYSSKVHDDNKCMSTEMMEKETQENKNTSDYRTDKLLQRGTYDCNMPP